MKDIPGFPNYQITEDGNVWSKNYKRFLTPEPPRPKCNYENYSLYKNGIRTHKFTHRLIAITYIDNPKNLPFVDHIDRDTTNNIVSNLRWVTKSQNVINRKLKNKLGYRHITFYNRKGRKSPYYSLRLKRNHKLIYSKYFSINKHKLEDVVKYRNEVVYPQFNIEIDD